MRSVLMRRNRKSLRNTKSLRRNRKSLRRNRKSLRKMKGGTNLTPNMGNIETISLQKTGTGVQVTKELLNKFILQTNPTGTGVQATKELLNIFRKPIFFIKGHGVVDYNMEHDNNDFRSVHITPKTMLVPKDTHVITFNYPGETIPFSATFDFMLDHFYKNGNNIFKNNDTSLEMSEDWIAFMNHSIENGFNGSSSEEIIALDKAMSIHNHLPLTYMNDINIFFEGDSCTNKSCNITKYDKLYRNKTKVCIMKETVGNKKLQCKSPQLLSEIVEKNGPGIYLAIVCRKMKANPYSDFRFSRKNQQTILKGIRQVSEDASTKDSLFDGVFNLIPK